MLRRSTPIIAMLLCMLSSLSCLAEVIEIASKEMFDETLENASKSKVPVVVKFHATWCGPCKQLKPIFEKLSNKDKYSDVIFLAVDVDKHEDLTSKYGIRGMPTTVFLDAAGKEAKRISGPQNFMEEASLVIDTKLLAKEATKTKQEVKVAPKKETTKKKNMKKENKGEVKKNKPE